jgi:hypothetical protein
MYLVPGKPCLTEYESRRFKSIFASRELPKHEVDEVIGGVEVPIRGSTMAYCPKLDHSGL